jgi:quaternary ammonium compound-resistance protein SugE
MAWAYLFLAGLFEIGWPVGLKLGWGPEGIRWPWIGMAVACMVMSGALLFLAQRHIPMGTAYAVWTGIGAVGAFALGIVAYGDPAAPLRVVSAALIVAGVVGLKVFG